jgi:hypothetical protein
MDLRHTDRDDRKSPYEYLVHYKGWKNTYVSFSFISRSVYTKALNFHPFWCSATVNDVSISFAPQKNDVFGSLHLRGLVVLSPSTG